MADTDIFSALPQIVEALETALAGGPAEAELAAAPLLDGWTIILRGSTPALGGRPTGHPTCVGPMMRTSPLLFLDEARGVARCLSRWYRLGPRGDIRPAPAVDDAMTKLERDLAIGWQQAEATTQQTNVYASAYVATFPGWLLKALPEDVDADIRGRLERVVAVWEDPDFCDARSDDDG